jgi:dTDP-4-amino-4,6-dideoxygalactose transaminase
VATAHSLLWNGIKPVFVDIEPETFNLDPRRIEAAITPQTTAIMPVHCYGRPCDVEAIQRIADTYNLRVIYDAAHAFGVRVDGRSVLKYGDLSVLSFHATKVFTTFEGGAIVCPDAKTKQRIDHLKNFGFANETTVVAPGINGKMSEWNAALGLLQLQRFGGVVRRRKQVDELYRRRLSGVNGIDLPALGAHESNYGYFPILVSEAYGSKRDALYEFLMTRNIYARRYFYPLISDFPMYRGMPSAGRNNLAVAARLADQVLCLPMSSGLEEADVVRVIDAILEWRRA